MRRTLLALALALLLPAALPAQRRAAATPYVPPRGEWARRTPAEAGLEAAWLDSAIAWHRAHESKAPRDLEQAHYQGFGREPFGDAVGPLLTRGEPTGVVLRGGYVVATWGDPDRVEPTFSVSKSFLSSVVGLAVHRGLIRSVDDTVRPYVGPVYPLRLEPRGDKAERLGTGADVFLPFESAHNRRITWDHLLRQTSDWEGTLWGKPEWADRPSGPASEWRTRPRVAPGSAWEYNDVRVNVLALAALSVWRRPLPEVLRDSLMDRIGASPTWRWFGYETSWIELDGRPVQSVSGGGHWGGGMFINAWDLARFGLLGLRRGRWGDREVLPEAWVRYALTPTPVNAGYGVMNWFLNGDGKLLPSAPRTAWAHLGNGTNLVYLDPEHDLVAVVRWIDNGSIDGFVERLVRAVRRP